jgi:hypothetical protein
VAQGVPHEAFVPAVLQSGEREELPPHSTEVLLARARLGAKHVSVGIVAERKPPLLQRFLQALRAYVDELLLARRLLALRLHFDGIDLPLFSVNHDERWLEVDVPHLDQHHLVASNTSIHRHHQPKTHQIALRADLVLIPVPDLALYDLAAEARRNAERPGDLGLRFPGRDALANSLDLLPVEQLAVRCVLRSI